MRQVLTSPDGGYYTTQGEGGGVFGKHGDFVTSPEISQVFGELIGIWTVAEWMAQGRTKTGVQLMEVGPGKGTLMDDMLRVSDHSYVDNRFANSLSRRSVTSRASPLVLKPSISLKPVGRSGKCKNACSVARRLPWKKQTSANAVNASTLMYL